MMYTSRAFERGMVMTEEMRKHYEIVFNDIMVNGPDMFKGVYDAHHGGTQHFMFGIQTVLEYIADKISDERYGEFASTFVDNMIKSEEKILDK